MRNIPDFTCEHGAAQLILENIDRGGKAYCLVLYAAEGQLPALLEECARFCAMVGAEQAFALPLPEIQETNTLPYPAAFQVVEMTADKVTLTGCDCALWPLLPENAEDYVRHYNAAMANVEGARRLKEKEIPRLLDRGGCYFVHRGDQLLGLGQVLEDRILTLATLVPGAGERVVRALAALISGDVVRLSVADTNIRAMNLYTRLGFVPTKVLESWWDITPRCGGQAGK